MDDALLAILVCPQTHAPLRRAETALLARLNERQAAGLLKNQGGTLLEEALEGGLVDAASRWFYPLREGIPVLLAEEAIALAEPSRSEEPP